MKRGRSVQRKILGLMAIGLLLVALGSAGLLRPVQSGVATIGAPFAGILSKMSASTSGWLTAATSIGGLAKENQQLRSEVADLKQRLSQEVEVAAQNDELRKQLNLGGVRPDKLIGAEVIGYQPDNFRQFITIGRGSTDGVRSGMAVISQGALVGTVQEVTPTTAKVFLVIDPTFRVTALDQDAPNRPTGTIYGQIGGGLVMDKIAQTETVSPGDTVVTAGTGSEIPKGLIIGKVQTVERRDNGVFQVAQVTSGVAFNRLEVVYVVSQP
ncbi:rod shape-determining protein MreC [Patescibacteria group bacterium]|nr:MAG: rod shape-determining protein MreC [Patescibacteria group bacterium]